jgi:hypothetical protein
MMDMSTKRAGPGSPTSTSSVSEASAAKRHRVARAREFTSKPDTEWVWDFASVIAAGEIAILQLSPAQQGSFEELFQKGDKLFCQAGEQDLVEIGGLQVHKQTSGRGRGGGGGSDERGACREDVGFLCHKALRLLTTALCGAEADEPLTNLYNDSDSTLSLGRVHSDTDQCHLASQR